MAAKRPGVETRTSASGIRSYRVRWRPGGGRGAQQSHTFPRLAEATGFYQELGVGGWICYCCKHAPPGQPTSPIPTGLRPAGDRAGTPAGPTFGEHARRHAAALTGVGEGYRRDVLRDVQLHFQSSRAADGKTIPGIADRPLAELTRLDVAEWIRGMETGAHWWLHRVACGRHRTQGAAACSDEKCQPRRSATTIQRNLAQAGAVMQSAVDAGLAARNPFRKHRLERVETDQHSGMTFLTWAEWRQLEEALPSGTPRDLCGFLIGSGLRWGEATALTVGAVDLLASPPRVHVGRAWKKDGKGGVVLGAPKSARSRRTVPLPTWVRDLLIPHVAGRDDDEFLFVGPRGGPLRHHSNFFNKVWTPAVVRAQVAGLEKRPRLHDLRHTYASWMLAEGRPVTEVSRRLGHQSVTITDSRYSHLLPEADAAGSAALEKYRTRAAD